MSTRKMLDSVLQKIRPSDSLLKKQAVIEKEILKKINSIPGNHVDAMLCGSSARNTHLADDIDLDFFVLYPPTMTRKDFENQGLALGQKVLKGHKQWKEYAEHPYIQGVYKGFNIEIVPTYKVSKASLLQSAVDRSPFHLKYMQEKLSKKQADDVRLLKSFLRSFNAYGAKLKVNSLPGFALELLILKYGSFMGTLEAIADWKEETVIDVEAHHKNLQVPKGKFNHHLIIVDPTDKNRNVAAALSFNQFARIITASRLFLEKPSKNFFFSKQQEIMPLSRIKSLLKLRQTLLLEFPYPKNSHPEIVFGQVKRLKKKMKTQLQLNDFMVSRLAYWSNEKTLVYFIVELSSLEIEKIKERLGPLVFHKEHSKSFLAHHKKSFAGPRLQKGRLVFEEKRKFWKAKDFLIDYWKQEFKKEKLPMKPSLNKIKVFDRTEIIEAFKKDKSLALFLTDFLNARDKLFDF